MGLGPHQSQNGIIPLTNLRQIETKYSNVTKSRRDLPKNDTIFTVESLRPKSKQLTALGNKILCPPVNLGIKIAY
jgi:hypothetical protein